MEHDARAFRKSNADPRVEASAPIAEDETVPPPGVTPATIRGILISLPIAALLWVGIFFLVRALL